VTEVYEDRKEARSIRRPTLADIAHIAGHSSTDAGGGDSLSAGEVNDETRVHRVANGKLASVRSHRVSGTRVQLEIPFR